MKAEHRKELQTNALADRLTRFAKNVKTGIQNSSLAVWALVILVIVIVAAWWYFRGAAKKSRAQGWVDMDRLAGEVGSPRLADPVKVRERLRAIIDKRPGTKTALMARFELARLDLVDEGLNRLPTQPQDALVSLEKARKQYQELADECKGDPYWEPQARLALAKITEAQAVKDPKNLDLARQQYEEVAKAYPNSAAGEEARERAKVLKEDPGPIADFYKQLASEKTT